MSKTIRKGLLVGLVVGGVIGLVIGLVVMIDGYSAMEDLEFMGWVVGLIVGLTVTGPIGLVIGALIGAFVGWVQGRNSSSRDQRSSSPDSLEKRPPERNLCPNCGCQSTQGSKTCEWCGAHLK